MEKRKKILIALLVFLIILIGLVITIYIVFKNDVSDSGVSNDNSVLLGEWKSFKMEFIDQGERLNAKDDTNSLYFIDGNTLRICMVNEGGDIPTCFITTYSYDSDECYIDIKENNTYLSGKIKLILEDNDTILIVQSQSYDGTIAREYFEKQLEVLES